MNRKSTIVLIGAAAVCVVLLVVAFAGGTATSDPDVRYNYETSVSHGFTSTSGYEVKPTEGYKFLIVTTHVYNDKADSISLGPLTWAWKLQTGGKEYTVSIYTFSHPLYEDSELTKGYDTRSVLIFEIPAGTTSYSLIEKFNWTHDTFKRDTSIVV